jgi:myosin heavy subunit
MEAFGHLQVSQFEVKQILALVSAVLHLGNIRFTEADTVI